MIYPATPDVVSGHVKTAHPETRGGVPDHEPVTARQPMFLDQVDDQAFLETITQAHQDKPLKDRIERIVVSIR